MNIKYEKLSLIGKIWSIRGEVTIGIDKKEIRYFISAMKKLNEVRNNPNYYMSNAVLDLDCYDRSFQNLVDNVVELEKRFIEGRESDFLFKEKNNLISKIWKIAEKVGFSRIKLKTNKFTALDLIELKIMHERLTKLYYRECKAKELTNNDRRDLLKILEEAEDVIVKGEKEFRKPKEQNL